MFTTLDIAHGNGVWSANDKFAKDPNTSMLGIGLGGTGVTALKELKRMVYTRLEADNEANVKATGATPIYSHYAFLAVDSDDTDMEDHPRDWEIGKNSDEFENIEIQGLSNYIQTNRTDLEKNPALRWFDFDMPLHNVQNGAGQIRQVGRFYLFQKASSLEQAIQQKLLGIIAGAGNAPIYICLFAGVGGGTGSGTFLDVCYLIRRVVDNNHWNNRVQVLGFFYLPDVTINSIASPVPAKINLIEANGCAAIRELDYYMNGEENSDLFTAEYDGGIVVSSDKRPVDMCHVLSITQANGALIQDGKNYIMRATAEYIINYLSAMSANCNKIVAGAANAQGEGFLTLRGAISNITAQVIAQTAHNPNLPGSNYNYTLIGAATALVPYRVMATYLASYVYEHMEYAKGIVPNAAEMDSFAEDTIGTCQSLYRELAKGTSGNPNLNAATFSASQLLNCAQGSRVCYEKLRNGCTDWLTREKGKLEENFNILSSGIANFDPLAAPASIAGKVFSGLTDEIKNPVHGPYYAEAMLNTVNANNLIAYIDGAKKYAEEQLRIARRDCYNFEDGSELHHISEAEQDLRRATRNLFESTDRKKAAYVGTFNSWYEYQFKCEVFSKMLTLLTNVRQQLIAMHSNYFVPLTNIMDECKDTFAANRAFFNAQTPTGRAYEYEIISVYDPVLKGSLDNAISLGTVTASDGSKRDPGRFTRLMDMYVMDTSWTERPEVVTGRILSAFIDNEFKDIMHQTMSTFFTQRFSGLSDSALVNAICSTVITNPVNGLSGKAQALFHANTALYNMDANSIDYTVLYVPDQFPEVIAAAKAAGAAAVRETSVTDSITMVRLVGCVPMYAYTPMRVYEEKYVAAGPVVNGEAIGPNGNCTRDYPEKKDMGWKIPTVWPAERTINGYNRPDALAVSESALLLQKAIAGKAMTIDGMGRYRAVITPEIDYDKLLIGEGNLNTIKAVLRSTLQGQGLYGENLEKEIKRLLPESVNAAVNAMSQQEKIEARGRVDSTRNQLLAYWSGSDGQVGCVDYKYDAPSDSVLRDRFYRFAWRRVMVKQEIAKLEKLDELLKVLGGQMNTLQIFRDLCCLGIISISNAEITCKDYTGEPDAVLWSRGTPGGLYAAYKKFDAHYNKQKEEMDEAINSAFKTLDISVAQGLKDRYTQERRVAEIGTLTDPAEQNAAKSFYKDFDREVASFIALNN